MNDYVVMDAETQKYAEEIPGGWNNVYGMDLASAVTYDSKSDSYTFWDHHSRENLCEYLNGKLVVTFNGIIFDSRLLLGNDRIIEPNGVTRNSKHSWNNLDIYVEMWRRILKMDKTDYPKIIQMMKAQRFKKGIFGLKEVSLATLNHTKSGDGADAPKLFKDGKIVELFQYNLQDVRITRQQLEFILKYKYLVTGTYDIVQFR